MAQEHVKEDWTPKYWNPKFTQGKNMIDQVGPFQMEKNFRGLNGFMDWAHIKIAKATPKAKQKTKKSLVKAKDFKIKFGRSPKPIDGQDLGICIFCGQTLTGYAATVRAYVNGKLAPKNKKDICGQGCEQRILKLTEESTQEDFKPEWDIQASRPTIESLVTMITKLKDLPPRLAGPLREEGFFMEATVPTAYAAGDLRKEVRAKEFSETRRQADPGRTSALVTWMRKNHQDIYDPEVFDTVTRILNGFDVSRERWERFEAYLDLDRELPAASQLPFRQEIYFWEKMSKEDPYNPLVSEKFGGKIDLETKLKVPHKVFSKDRWAELFGDKTLKSLLEQKAATEAESDSVEQTATHLGSRREAYNRDLMNFYTAHQEFSRLLGILEGELDKDRARMAREYEEDPESKPESVWTKPTYAAIRNFFDEANKICEKNDITMRDYILNFTRVRWDQGKTVRSSDDLIKLLFTEARKLDLVEELKEQGEENHEAVLRQSYAPVIEAARQMTDDDAENFRIALEDILPHAALEIEILPGEKASQHLPSGTKNALKSAGFTVYNSAVKVLREVRASMEHGIVPKKHAKNLERIAKLTKHFKEDETTEQSVKQIAMLTEDTLTRLKIDVSAHTGCTSKRIGIPKFRIANYVGRTYFTSDQVNAVGQIMIKLTQEGLGEVTQETLDKARGAFFQVEGFYKTHKIFTDQGKIRTQDGWTSNIGHYLFFHEQELEEQEIHGLGELTNPIQVIEEFEAIQTLERGEEGKYVPFTDELKAKVKPLTDIKLKIPGNRLHFHGREGNLRLNDIMNSDSIVITRDLATKIEKAHDQYMRQITL